MNKSYKLTPIPFENWIPYHKAIQEILYYSYPDRRRNKKVNKFVGFEIMVREEAENKEPSLLFFLKIYDQATRQLVHMLIYPAETDLYIILNDLIESDTL